MGMGGEAAPLPRWPTSLVGRAGELAALGQLLARSRLVTVTGPGGVGKTRLAAHASAELAGRFPAGVWFADLAALSGTEQVEPALAGILAAGDTGGRPLAEAIAARPAGAAALLVLDNCEHLIGECARVARVLVDRCAGLTVLATSREPLLVSGEMVFPLSPLPADEAVRLFMERARDRSPGFPESASPAVVRRICARLDGLPLAIELAAARVAVLGAGEIEERLAGRFELLAGGRRDSPPRHRALGALVDWSYRLLDEDESGLFRALSVMAGEFDLEAAEALGGDGSLGVLGRLVDKSMVTVTPGPGGTRYRLLETLRDYGLEKLAASGEADAAWGRHSAYFAAAVEAAYDRRMTTGSDTELARLARDMSNLRGRTGLGRDDGPADGPAAGRGHAGDLGAAGCSGRAVAARAADRRLPGAGPLAREGPAGPGPPGDAPDGPPRGRARLRAKPRRLRRCRGPARPGVGRLLPRGCRDSQRGHSGARPWLEQGSRLFSSCENRFGLCRVAGSAGQLLVVSDGDRAEARRLLGEELAIADELGERWSRGHARVFLAALELREGRAAEAARHAESAVGELASGGDAVMISIALAFLARALAARDPSRALRLASAASAMQTRIGSQFNAVPHAAIEQTRVLTRRAVGGHAADRAWAEGQQLTWAEAIRLAGQGPRPRPARRGGLTAREQEVAELVADGLTNRAVASRLHLSERTVETHVLHACTKLGLANRTQLARWVQHTGTGLSTS